MKPLRFSAVVAALGAALWAATPMGLAQRDGPTFVEGELLIKFRPTATESRRSAARQSIAAKFVRRFQSIDVEHVLLPTGLTVAAALQSLRQNSDVLRVAPNYIRQIVASQPPNDPLWLNDSLWGLTRIGAPAAWSNFGTGSDSVVAAVIDTGIDYLHPDLSANVWTNPGEIPGNGIDDDGNGYIDDVHGIDTFNHDSNPVDDHGHGTHVAGTIGAVGNNGIGVVGINWRVKLIACKFMSSGGSGPDSAAIECFDYLTSLKLRGINVRVTNNSWGSDSGDVDTFLKDAIDAAGNAGIVNVFAAGNNGTNNDVMPFSPASYTSPSIVAVAASETNDGRAGFSNYGLTSVDLAAPGAGIISTAAGGGYASAAGTSMAAPHVAGAVAMVASLHPEYSVSDIKNVLLENVDRLGSWDGLVASGGRLNLFASLLATPNVGAPVTLLTTQTPANPSMNTRQAWELGLRVRSDVAGQITGLRFWKGPNENGPHVGHVWSGTGQLLATVTFVNEGASGWQQQALGTPVAIAANTDYVVSVTTGPNGNFAFSLDGFANGFVQGHLRAPANGAVYGTPDAFPASTAAHNYFRDLVFVSQTGVPDGVPPTVSISEPAAGGTVSAVVTIAATAADNVAVAGVHFQVDGNNIGGEIVPPAAYRISWDSTSVVNGLHTITAIASDAAGNQTSASINVTVANTGNPPQTLLAEQTPGSASANTGQAWELGVRVRSDVAGQLRGLRFWKGPGENGPHVGHVWTSTGQLLATVTFANESPSGWQEQALGTPLAIAANTDYVVSVSTGPNGNFAITNNTFVNGLVQGNLQVPASGAVYGAPGAFPTSTAPHNYFRDLSFVPNTGGPPETLVTSQTPGSPSVNTGQAWELGVRVRSNVTGQLTALRFWKGPSENGPHVGHVWSGTGQLLATVTFSGESASGWQQQTLGTPVAMAANTDYVVSVTTGPNGNFAMTLNAFANGFVQGHLQAPPSGAVYSAPGAFPALTAPHNYFRDLVFVPQ